MICWRCDEPILPGEAYETLDICSPTGAGGTVYLHEVLCERVETQTTQGSIRH